MASQERLVFAVRPSEFGNRDVSDMTFILPEDFDVNNFSLEISPTTSESIFPVERFQGKDLDSKESRDAFIGGWLALYTPMAQENDLIMLKLTYGQQRHEYNFALRFSDKRWNAIKFGVPVVISSQQS